ncbi:MAG: nucleoside deaminase [Peptoniphilus sp.]|nr:nucleoside deaminase [Peptoniphilus sp.]MDY6045104.1 nucleoside deaminase [Peptoniphilus sp.]
MDTDRYYMEMALQEARRAAACGEVPIGCVIVRDGEVIGRGHNMSESAASPLAHAELIAIDEASKAVKTWRIEGDLYVTVEPCPMCMGAILNARIKRLVIGTDNPRFGAAGSVVNLSAFRAFNHSVTVTSGVMEEACAEAMTSFFRRLRD